MCFSIYFYDLFNRSTHSARPGMVHCHVRQLWVSWYVVFFAYCYVVLVFETLFKK